MRRLAWGQWVEQQRLAAGMSKREAARTAGFDPSYMTLVENGYVPKRDMVQSLVSVLTTDKCLQDIGMIYAGYAPVNVGIDEMTNVLTRIHTARSKNGHTGTGGESLSVVPEN